MAENSTLYLFLREGAALSLIDLVGWERERISDALVLLTIDPRPRAASRLAEITGEAFELWVGERRLQYNVYKDDVEDADRIVIITGII